MGANNPNREDSLKREVLNRKKISLWFSRYPGLTDMQVPLRCSLPDGRLCPGLWIDEVWTDCDEDDTRRPSIIQYPLFDPYEICNRTAGTDACKLTCSLMHDCVESARSVSLNIPANRNFPVDDTEIAEKVKKDSGDMLIQQGGGNATA